MAKQGISTGTTPNDGTGSTLLAGALKVNSNFDEIYNLIGDGTTLMSGIVTSLVAGSGISLSGSVGVITVTSTGGASGGGSFGRNSTGIHTSDNVGVGTTTSSHNFNVTGETNLIGGLNVSGVGSVGHLKVSGETSVGGGLNVSGVTTFNNNVILSGDNRVIDFVADTINEDHVTGIRWFESGSTDARIAIDYNGDGSLPHSGQLEIKGYNNDTSSYDILTVIDRYGKVGIGSTQPIEKLTVSGNATVTGFVSATSFYGDGTNLLPSRTTVVGSTGAISDNAIGNIDLTGFKSYFLMKVGLSTAGWLRLYTSNSARTDDVSRSVGEDPIPGSGVIADIVTTGVSTTQIVSPFVPGGNLNDPADTTIYAAITNQSGITTSISVDLTLLQLEA